MRFATTAPRVAASCALVAIVVVPLFANPLSARVFDPERAVLFRLLALPALVAALFAVKRFDLRSKLDLGAVLYFAGTLLACLFSDTPFTALSGDYTRQAGILTDVALIGVFLACRRLREDTARCELLIRALLLAGVAQSLIAVTEAAGTGVGRAFALAGGATFLGSHLALLLPLAIARLRTKLDVGIALAIAAGLVASGSRVACLAALAGAAIVALRQGGVVARRSLYALGGVVALVALLALPPLANLLPAQSLPVRAGALFSRQSGDAELRLLLYRDAFRALAREPDALLTGHGPDSTAAVFGRDVSEELQRRLGGNARVDRFHCDVLDVLFQRGILGLAGLLLLWFGAIRVASREARREPNSRDARDRSHPGNPGDTGNAGTTGPGSAAFAVAALGMLVAAFVDASLSVPGVTSRLFVFAIAGLLSRPSAVRSPQPADTVAPDARDRGLVFAALLVTLAFATDGDARMLAAIAFLPLLPRRDLGRAILTALPVVLGYALARFVLGHLAKGATPEVEATLRWLLIGAFDLCLAYVAVRLCLDSASSPPGTGVSAERTAFTPARWIAGVVGLVMLVFAEKDDVRRQGADAIAAIASRVQHEYGKPEIAESLLDRAAELAPEIVRYSMRAAIAGVDVAESFSPDDTTALEAAWVRTSERVHACSLRAPRDGFLLAEGADALLRLAERVPTQRALIVAHAMRLARPARDAAPTALPVMQAAARLEIELGNPELARSILERAITIDNSQGLTHLLLGRVNARRGELAAAAWYYSLALPSGVGKPEALAGVALAAAAQGGETEAAHLLVLIAEIAPRFSDLRAEVRGARPLLRHVAYHQLVRVFALAEAEWRGDPAVIARVRAALDY